MQPTRPEVGRQLLIGDARSEIGDPAATDLGSRAAARKNAIEEDRQVELAGQQLRGHERLGARRPALRVADVDERHDVDRADVRVLATCRPKIDPRDGLAGARQERSGKRPRLAGKRKDGAMVVRILVAIEHASAGGEGVADRVQRRAVAAFGDVRHREQRRHLLDDTGRRASAQRSERGAGSDLRRGKVPIPAGVAQSVRAAES